MPTNNNNDNSRRRSGAKPQIDTKYAHLQPQDIGLERVVLGALMVDSDAFSMVSEMLKHPPSMSLVIRKSMRPYRR